MTLWPCRHSANSAIVHTCIWCQVAQDPAHTIQASMSGEICRQWRRRSKKATCIRNYGAGRPEHHRSCCCCGRGWCAGKRTCCWWWCLWSFWASWTGFCCPFFRPWSQFPFDGSVAGAHAAAAQHNTDPSHAMINFAARSGGTPPALTRHPRRRCSTPFIWALVLMWLSNDRSV